MKSEVQKGRGALTFTEGCKGLRITPGHSHGELIGNLIKKVFFWDRSLIGVGSHPLQKKRKWESRD